LGKRKKKKGRLSKTTTMIRIYKTLRVQIMYDQK